MSILKAFSNLLGLTMLFLASSGPVLADAYYSDRNGVIYLTDNPPDSEFDVIATAPVVEFVASVVPSDNTGVVFLQQSSAVDVEKKYNEVVTEASRSSGVDSGLIHAVIKAESNYNPRAISPKGAMGMMQLMPATAKTYGVSNPYDPSQNITAGARYLSHLMTLFSNDLNLALAAYNAGQGAVARYGNRIPPFPETLTYVKKVLSNYRVRTPQQVVVFN